MQAIREDSEKRALLAGSTIDDLLIPRGEATPENWHRVAKTTFSTVSLGWKPMTEEEDVFGTL